MQRKSNTGKKVTFSSVNPTNPMITDDLTTKQVVRRTKRYKPRYIKVCLSVLGLYLVFAFAAGGYQLWQLKMQLNILEGERILLLEKQEGLVSEIQSLNEAEIIERIARESLGMVKSGETIVVPAIAGENIPTPKEVKPEDMGD
jgi:cell division protein FtsB